MFIVLRIVRSVITLILYCEYQLDRYRSLTTVSVEQSSTVHQRHKGLNDVYALRSTRMLSDAEHGSSFKRLVVLLRVLSLFYALISTSC